MNVGQLFWATDKEIKKGMCPTCGENKALPKHPCPYEAELNGNEKKYCHCCENCMSNCAMDI